MRDVMCHDHAFFFSNPAVFPLRTGTAQRGLCVLVAAAAAADDCVDGSCGGVHDDDDDDDDADDADDDDDDDDDGEEALRWVQRQRASNDQSIRKSQILHGGQAIPMPRCLKSPRRGPEPTPHLPHRQARVGEPSVPSRLRGPGFQIEKDCRSSLRYHSIEGDFQEKTFIIRPE